MTEKDAKAFQNDISGDSRIFCLIDENEQEDAHKTPPTKLKNPKLFKPFEMYTKMYAFRLMERWIQPGLSPLLIPLFSAQCSEMQDRVWFY